MRPSTVALAALFITPISTTPIYEPSESFRIATLELAGLRMVPLDLITRHSISSAMPGGSRLSEVSTQDTDHNTLDPWQRRQLPSSDPESNGTWQRRDSEDEDEEEEDDDDDDEDDDDEKDFLDEMAHAEEDPALADAELAGVVTAASLMLILLIAFLIIRYRRRKHSKQNVSSEQHAPETTSLGSSLISLLRPLEPSQTGPSQTCSHSNQSFEKLLPVPRVASINHLTPEKPSTQPPSTAVQECSHTGQPIKR